MFGAIVWFGTFLPVHNAGKLASEGVAITGIVTQSSSATKGHPRGPKTCNLELRCPIRRSLKA